MGLSNFNTSLSDIFAILKQNTNISYHDNHGISHHFLRATMSWKQQDFFIGAQNISILLKKLNQYFSPTR